MTDDRALFHNPESFTDQELKTMRWKLWRQKMTTPVSFLLGTGTAYLIDQKVYNSRYTARSPGVVVVPGLMFMFLGSYAAYTFD